MDAISLDLSAAVEAPAPTISQQSSQRSSPRAVATYTSYVPGRTGSLHNENDTDPFTCSQDRNLNTPRVCAKSAYAVQPAPSGSSCFYYLPVVFVVLCFALLYCTFMRYHLMPAIQNDLSHFGMLSNRTFIILLSLHVLCALFLVSYVLCATVDPGRVPKTVEWSIYPGSDKATPANVCETTKSGDRRICKWCNHYKPDRAHHCRICGRCVLKMDHHCPWVHNCIGWGNHKYFFLCLFYATTLSSMIAIISYPTVYHVVRSPLVQFNDMLVLLVGEILSIFFCVICGLFLCFHIWLMCDSYTTIEFCEKRSYGNMWLDRSIWSGTLYDNLSSVLGQNPLLWLLPVDDRLGDGVTFTPHGISDGPDEEAYDENSAFLKMARNTKQFEPILEV
ncbi:cell cycle regulator with zn-finger domain-containing protein [Babesia caballi]|uniref:Palmitoyltransferase n=1 Tax=Babesia caballi TaxID=5871 RepID=A0AAV4LM88_BABCB|nr:cell cycle regulator with zn-finger domain-containing protein [Babesia caballi]